MTLTPKELRKSILFAVFVFLIIKFFAIISDMVIITAVSILLAMVLNPAVCYLEKKRIPRHISAMAIGLSVIGLIVLTSVLTFPSASKQAKQLFTELPDIAQKVNDKFYVIVERYGLEEIIKKQDFKMDSKSAGNAASSILSGASKLGMNLVKVLTSLFLAFIVTTYLLANPKPLIDGGLKFFGDEQKAQIIRAVDKFSIQIKAWAGGVFIGMIFIFFLTWIGLLIIGVKQAFLFALIAGFLEAVPIIGPLLSAIPPIIVCLIQNPISALYVAILFLVIQQFEGNVLIPMIMMKQLSIHPVIIIFTVVVMGGLFGIAGVFLATPTAAAIGVILDEFYLNNQHSEINSSTSPE